MEKPPKLYIIAGPNGIGKTSTALTQISMNVPIINADEITKQLKETFPQINVQELAQDETTKQINFYLGQKLSFGFETNLADLETWKFIERVQILGYQIVVTFYCLDDVKLCIERVENRVKQGGHFVRPDIVKARYENGLKLVHHFKYLPDLLLLVDNATHAEVCAILEKGQLVEVNDSPPNWVKLLIFEEKQLDSADSITAIREKYRKMKRND